jgi:O-antigen/teichoic acid export membrane protein
MANGGPIVIGGLGGPDAHVRAGLMLNALTLTRMPQFVLSPAVNNLLPHLSRIAAIGDRRAFDRFAGTALVLIVLAGGGLVGGTWLMGELAMRLTFGSDAAMDRGLLTTLALLAALYLLNELLNQMLFARGFAALAAVGWVLGLLATGVGIAVLSQELLTRVAYALTLGAAFTTVFLAGGHILSVPRHTISAGVVRPPADSSTHPTISP